MSTTPLGMWLWQHTIWVFDYRDTKQNDARRYAATALDKTGELILLLALSAWSLAARLCRAINESHGNVL